jgi:hypothetical protein
LDTLRNERLNSAGECEKMDKITSLLTITVFTLLFIGCECLIHYVQSLVAIGYVAAVSLRLIEIISAAGAVVETVELAFGLQVKIKIREVFECLWKKGISKLTANTKTKRCRVP